jgi:hypothetical protein
MQTIEIHTYFNSKNEETYTGFTHMPFGKGVYSNTKL